MNNEEQERKNTLDHMIDEKFGELFFLAKDEFDIENNTPEEQKLYDMLERFKDVLKRKCKHHFEAEEPLDDHPLTKWDEGQTHSTTKPKRYRGLGRTVGDDDSIIGL